MLASSPEGKFRARILLVEDEPSARQAIAKILQTYGHEVVDVADGDEALAAFSGGGFDLVLTDLTLPGMSGWEVAKRIRQEGPGTAVAVISGWDIKEDDVNIKESGVSLVISKPVKVKEIIGVIEQLAGKGKRG